jgi:type IV pilus assembly protein PilO
MGARHADRLWLIAGAAVIALLSVVTWFLLVSPAHTEASDLRAEADTTRAQATELRKRTAVLKKEKADLPELEATLAAYQDALPSDSGVPAFLRQLQDSGGKVGVVVSGIRVSAPAPQIDQPGVWALPIQLSATGSAARLGDFLDLLQGADQKRAVLIESAALVTDDETKALSLDLAVKAFVAPPVGAGVPVVTTD